MGTYKQIKKHKWTHKAQTYAKYTKNTRPNRAVWTGPW